MDHESVVSLIVRLAFPYFCDRLLTSYDCHLQKDPKTGESEGLAFEFNLCESVASWEQVGILSTLLTYLYGLINTMKICKTS